MIKNKQPSNVFLLTLWSISSYYSQSNNLIPLFKVRHNFFKYFFFLSTGIESNSIDIIITNAEFQLQLKFFITTTILMVLDWLLILVSATSDKISSNIALRTLTLNM